MKSIIFKASAAGLCMMAISGCANYPAYGGGYGGYANYNQPFYGHPAVVPYGGYGQGRSFGGYARPGGGFGEIREGGEIRREGGEMRREGGEFRAEGGGQHGQGGFAGAAHPAGGDRNFGGYRRHE